MPRPVAVAVVTGSNARQISVRDGPLALAEAASLAAPDRVVFYVLAVFADAAFGDDFATNCEPAAAVLPLNPASVAHGGLGPGLNLAPLLLGSLPQGSLRGPLLPSPSQIRRRQR